MKSSDHGLLREFRKLFEGVRYNHRDSSLGDKVASYLYEDLYNLGISRVLHERIASRIAVVNVQNRTVGIRRRRGDGTFGELVPVAAASIGPGFQVGRGPVANIEIGAEVKILAKAMIKQIDRVIGDLMRQVTEFQKHGGHPICVGIVAVNFSPQYTSYEGQREFPTGGAKYKHPIQEAESAILRLQQHAQGSFDEFIILKFIATNVPPHPFTWLDENQTLLEYSALLTRLSREYDRRFK